METITIPQAATVVGVVVALFVAVIKAVRGLLAVGRFFGEMDAFRAEARQDLAELSAKIDRLIEQQESKRRARKVS
jgi:pheromone shutdown protein TraB